MKKQKEWRVYLIDIEQGSRDEILPNSTTDKEFIEIAERNGSVYSLSGYEDALNNEEYPVNQWVRILEV